MNRALSILLLFYIQICLCFSTENSQFWTDLNFHPDLLPWHVSSDEYLRLKCKNEPGCPVSADFLAQDKCFGFETGCMFNNSYSFDKIKCFKQSRWPQGKNRDIQKRTFWEQGDYGSAVPRVTSMKVLCSSSNDQESYLECSDHLRICRARNIFFSFQNFTSKRSERYRNDIIHSGQVGGKCSFLDKELLAARTDEKSYLQSWGAELEHFESYNDFRMDPAFCDVIFDRPTVVIKLDASVNMYHHFCDFVNLYMSQFINGSFSQDIDIFWWDTYGGGFVDEYFGDTWRAFSAFKPHELIHFEKKRVCFRNALLPQLARQRLNIYYNMPLIDGCRASGFFEAFSKHMTHRLKIAQHNLELNKVRVTILQRNSMARKIVNAEELLDGLFDLKNVQAKIVTFDKSIPFLKQIEIVHNSDVLIGIHGAGLTHMLFLPNWAAVFEIYNCGDPGCYEDLARLRGLNYFTWRDETLLTIEKEGRHPTMQTPHKKFHNYSFNVPEFVNITKKAIEQVRRHPEFVEKQRKLRRLVKSEL